MNKCYFIAGATSDLGRGLTWQLAKRNQSLLLADTSSEALESLADALIAAGYPEPELIVISTIQLEQGCIDLKSAMKGKHISHWFWVGYALSNPAPMQHMSLSLWQDHIMQNITYPLWLLNACLSCFNDASQIWIAQPKAETFTHGLNASHAFWLIGLTSWHQETGISEKNIHLWEVPRIADRIHRRIWPLAPIEDFVSIDSVVIKILERIKTEAL